MTWFKRFASPILLPDGSALLTLHDASDHIVALPSAEYDAAEWKVAREALFAAAERDAPVMLAWAAVLNALHREKPPPAPEPPDTPPPKPPRLRIVR